MKGLCGASALIWPVLETCEAENSDRLSKQEPSLCFASYVEEHEILAGNNPFRRQTQRREIF